MPTTNLSLPYMEIGQGGKEDAFNTAMDLIAAWNVPRCLVTHNAHQSVANGAEAQLVFNTEYKDTHGMHSTSSNTARLTVQIAGVYIVGAMIEFATSAGGTSRNIQLRRYNSAGTLQEIFGVQSGIFNGSTAGRASTVAMTQVSCTVGDWFEVWTFQDSGGALNVNASTISIGAAYKSSPLFWCVWIGA